MTEKQSPNLPDATMYDVARLAGMSTMIVSRVINANKLVNEATRKRVTLAIARLKYEVNVAARVGSLRLGLSVSCNTGCCPSR